MLPGAPVHIFMLFYDNINIFIKVSFLLLLYENVNIFVKAKDLTELKITVNREPAHASEYYEKH